ncbi:MAG TPA: hypothetical protein VN612_10380 [Acidobacteriaceae bacterium]|nr:hypothetical protein [Acidobacteriaceae bacterium]
MITATLLVDGNQVTAVGDMQYSCGNGPSGAGGSFALSGQIDASGSFHLAPPPNLPGAGVQLSIDGTVPSGGQPDWSGTYTLSDAPGYTSCLVSKTGSFTATAFAPLNNTVYAGSVSSQFGTLDISVVLTEGAAVTQPNDAHLPVSGSITVSGSSCFSHGTTNAIAPGEMEGDISSLRFEMDDGSHINFTGIFGSPDESTLQPVLVGVLGGQCSGQAYLGAMVRQ